MISRLLAYIILALTLCIFSTLVITNVSDKIGKYEQAMKEFGLNEEKALWMYKVDWDNASFSTYASYRDKLIKEGINLWEENILLLEKIKNDDYDEQHVQLIDLLIDYSMLRKKSCEIIIESLDEDSPENFQKIEDIHKQIENKIKEIKDFKMNM